MALSGLIQAIALATTQLSLLATALFALSWVIGSLLKGAPIPFKEWKQWGQGLQMDAIKATFELAIWSFIGSLVAWIAYLISLSVT
ncbi:MAG: hypothetical protein H3Z53_11290 [archaeon]|nr:hypothetical protein [archaeon]MCP8314936.1 hypothetical protein [archaeon]